MIYGNREKTFGILGELYRFGGYDRGAVGQRRGFCRAVFFHDEVFIRQQVGRIGDRVRAFYDTRRGNNFFKHHEQRDIPYNSRDILGNTYSFVFGGIKAYHMGAYEYETRRR